MSPRRTWTELFFLDEPTAFAAGHRPCATCRSADYRRFRALWETVHPADEPGADAIDRRLHAERARGRAKRTARVELAGLPDGAMVARGGTAWLVQDRHLLEWSPAGYLARVPRPAGGSIDLLTPLSVVDVFRAGYRPVPHPSVRSVGQRSGGC